MRFVSSLLIGLLCVVNIVPTPHCDRVSAARGGHTHSPHGSHARDVDECVIGAVTISEHGESRGRPAEKGLRFERGG
jgi:hypothetical protein